MLKKILNKVSFFFKTCNNCGEYEKDCECPFGPNIDD